MTGTSSAIVELIRLAVVLIVTAVGFAVGTPVDDLLGLGDPEQTRAMTSVLGALVGYLIGGGLGRLARTGVDTAQQRLEQVEAATMVATVLGATLATAFGLVLLSPVWFLPGRIFTVPAAVVVLLVLLVIGGRFGAARGGDLSRYVGVRGRLEVSSPSRGGGVKLVDSSALMDARLVDVARAGFLEGTLVVPRFVLEEVQGQADAEEPRRRRVARRGLDALRTLQDEGLLPVEVTDEDPAGVADVDARLTTLARERQAGLLTVDSNLARVAEVAGIRVLNLHALAEALRPPVLPGDRLELTVVKEGREPAQGVGYLEDGTMVVVERTADRVGQTVTVDVTSIMQNRQGRMLFAVPGDEP